MLLKGLSRQEIISKIKAFATSEETQNYILYYDYYTGTHFVKSGASSDYSHTNNFWITTRSGRELFDEISDEERYPVKSNWCKPIIEAIGDYTRGVNEEIIVTAEDKEKELQDIWKKNKIDVKTHEIAYEAGIYGKTYIRIRRKEKDSPIEILNVEPASIHENKNPITDETESVIYYFAIPKWKAKELYPDVDITSDDGWVYYAEEWDDNELLKYIDGALIDGVKTLNPYGFIPFREVKGNIYNSSDIHDVISLNDELNIHLTYINEIFKYHAFPVFAPKGNYDGNNLIDPEALKDVEISPRAILNFPIERIEGKGIDGSVKDHLESIRKDISVVSGVPIKLLTAEIDGDTSGVALERMMSSIIKQAEVRRNYIRDAYKTINSMILQLIGGRPETETDIRFPDIMKIDLNERLDEALKKQTLGISKETIFVELGYEYEEEEKARQEEFDNSLEKRLIDESESIQSNTGKKQEKGADTNKRKVA